MPPALSVYLDLIRLLAAVVVVLAHLAEKFFPGIPLPFPGKDAVIAFFVLSGFVVSYVADTRERHWADFAISRFSRLVCVFYPAMMLSVAIVPFVAYPGWRSWRDAAGIVPAIGLNTAFLGQVWFLNITPPNNDPSWSLDYEAWYYLIFAVATYVRGAARWPLAALAALCAGPKILILMPCWIAGCLLYRYGAKLTVRAPAATIMFLASIGLYAVYFVADLNVLIRGALQHAIPSLMLHLQWSNRFAGDYLLCAIVCMNFVAARSMENAFTRTLLRHGRLIRGGQRIRSPSTCFTLLSWPPSAPLSTRRYSVVREV